MFAFLMLSESLWMHLRKQKFWKTKSRVVQNAPKDVIRIASSNEEVRKVNRQQLTDLNGQLERSVAQTFRIKNV